jgi:hypothetical protein
VEGLYLLVIFVVGLAVLVWLALNEPQPGN